MDDHTVVRTGLRLLLEAEPDLAIVGEAGNGRELLAQLPTTPTDVVLLNNNMPGLDGPTTARQLRAQYPAVQVLALSMHDQEEYIYQMLDTGAKGYLLKSAGLAKISTGIRTVAAGSSCARPPAWLPCTSCATASPSRAVPPIRHRTTFLGASWKFYASSRKVLRRALLRRSST